MAQRDLEALVVFRNLIRPELIRTVHLYRSESESKVVVEREFVFHKDTDYQEIIDSSSFFTNNNNNSFEVCCYFQGLVNGVWVCIFVFDAHSGSSPHRLPTLLTLSRNPKLQTIPSLTHDIQTITHFTSSHITNTQQSSNNNGYITHLDLNSLPQGLSQTHTDVSWKKKKRAATKDIASLGLEDLAKYFDLPIIEASKNLKVGLTVLKKKCREFGIPRWPHRKIKSLDGLISDLQEEVKRQQEEDEGAALAVAERQKMIESEKERIEKKPSMDLQRETKKFRQDVFKKRHRARVLENQCRTLPLF